MLDQLAYKFILLDILSILFIPTADFSEVYQASLRPHSPDKPLPDESGFTDYASPPPPANPYGQPYYAPIYYPPPQLGHYAPFYYPAPPPPMMPPPPPPPVMCRPLLLRPYNPPPLVRYRRLEAPSSDQPEQLFTTSVLYGALVILGLLLFTLVIVSAFAMAGNRPPRRQHRTEVDLVRYSTLPVRQVQFSSPGTLRFRIQKPDDTQGAPLREHVDKDDVQDAR